MAYGSIPRATYARKKHKTVQDDIEEESEVLPQTKSARQINLEKKLAAGPVVPGKKSVAQKPPPVKSFTKMKYQEYKEYRERNPYLVPRQDTVLDPRFYTDDQARVSPAEPAPAAAAAATANPHKRKNKGKGGGNPNKKKQKLKGLDDATRRRRNKPSAKFLKLLEKRARDYNSDDDDGVAVQGQGHSRRSRQLPPKQRDGDGDAARDGDEVEAAPSSEEEASSSGGESDDGEKVVTRFEEGCRAFRVAFAKIMSKKLADDPLGPILSAHKKLVAAKLAEEADEHKSNGEARKEKRIAAEKGHVIPANHIDNKEKLLIKVATQGVVRLFNEVSKRQTRKGLNPSRSKAALAKEGTHSVPSNQGQNGQASSKLSKHIGKDEDEPGWAPLRDTYMLGTKLKDWDKAQDSDVVKQTEVPFDNFSDEE